MKDEIIEQPYITVVVPIYNSAHILDKTLQSIRRQTAQNIEIICVDDGSSDGSRDIVNANAAVDARVKLIMQEHSGAACARNKGLATARGTYVAFLDSDDIYELDMLEKMLLSMGNGKADISICEIDLLDMQTGKTMPLYRIPAEFNNGMYFRVQGGRSLNSLCSNSPVNKLFRKDFITRHNIWFQNLNNTNDLFFSWAAIYSARSISLVKEPLITYRVNQKASSIQDGYTKNPFCSFIACYTAFEWIKQNVSLTTSDLYDIRANIARYSIAAIRRAAFNEELFSENCLQFAHAMNHEWGVDSNALSRMPVKNRMIYHALMGSTPARAYAAFSRFANTRGLDKLDRLSIGSSLAFSAAETILAGNTCTSIRNTSPRVDIRALVHDLPLESWADAIDSSLSATFKNDVRGGVVAYEHSLRVIHFTHESEPITGLLLFHDYKVAA